MENLIGQKLNQRYEVLSILGEGGMGAVLKGFDPVLDREVAIKVMHPHFSRQPNMRERFLQEARTAGKLNHSSIVKVYDFGQQASLLYIVMEYIEGDNLREILDGLKEKGKWIPLRESLLISSQLASALDYAHRHGVLHRDIKPANIMLLPEPISGLAFRPVLTDLGLAKLLEGQPITRDGVSMGTPAYMSPEQALGQHIDARSDVYSLGILLFELCTGHPPFPARSISDAIRFHTKEPPPPPRSIRADIPKAVEDVILKAIEKDPDNRYRNAEELSLSLQKIDLESSRLGGSNTVSIMTEYQQSLIERNKSILREFDPISKQREDVLQVLDADHNSKVFELTGRTLTIGRGRDNEVVIDDHKLSRQHAKIEFDGKDYFVTDLQSTNGTYLANTRLLPGVPEVWPADKAVRMGNSWFYVRRATGEIQEPVTDRYTAVMSDEQAKAYAQSITGKRVTATIETDHLQVNPGESVRVTVKLLNHGQLVDHFRLNLVAIPEDWVTVSEKGIQLMPGEQGELVFTIHPPRQPESKAGEYPFRIQVISQVAAGEHTEIEATLLVTPYYQFDFVIRPQRQRGTTEAQFTTVLRNLCNTDLTFNFEAEDPEDRCQFAFEPDSIRTQPGHELTGKMSVSLKRNLPSDEVRTFGFSVIARPQERLELFKQSFGEWKKTPLLLDLEISPVKARSSRQADYDVTLHNRSDQDLPIQMAGSDEERLCILHFDPKSLVIPAGDKRKVHLTVAPGSQFAGEEREIGISVTASLVNSPDLTQQKEAIWVKTVPSFEGRIEAVQSEGEDQGSYSIKVKNLSDAPLTVDLKGIDQNQKCLFVISPSSVSLEPNEQKSVSLAIKPKDLIYGENSQQHPFQVVLQPTGYPGIERRLEAVWEQIPAAKSGSLFLCWLLIALGWAIALPLGGFLLREIFSFSTFFEAIFTGVFIGILTGGIGGLMTGLGIKSAYPDFKFRHVIGTTIAWILLWSLYYGFIALG